MNLRVVAIIVFTLTTSVQIDTINMKTCNLMELFNNYTRPKIPVKLLNAEILNRNWNIKLLYRNVEQNKDVFLKK